MKGIYYLKRAHLFLKDTMPILLSHHPDCEMFANDYYRIGHLKLCKGCFTAYPTAILIIVLHIMNIIQFQWYEYIIYGVVVGSAQFLSFTDITRYNSIKIFVKIFLGIGVGFVIIGVFTAPFNILIRLFTFFFLVNLAGILSYFRIKKMTRICLECEWKADWNNCPGFADVIRRLKRDGFHNDTKPDYYRLHDISILDDNGIKNAGIENSDCEE